MKRIERDKGTIRLGLGVIATATTKRIPKRTQVREIVRLCECSCLIVRREGMRSVNRR